MSNRKQFKRFKYYFGNTLALLIPKFFYRVLLEKNLAKLAYYETKEVEKRVDYYNKLSSIVDGTAQFEYSVASFKKTHGTTYFFDLYNIIKYFKYDCRFSMVSGDVTEVPNRPSFVKSRPISAENENAVLLKLNKIRHFNFVDDKTAYQQKKDKVAWRGAGYQSHRIQVIKQFYNHRMCNIGQTKPYSGELWEKGYMSIEEQLQYKFLLCIEGNDVASNLKWVMSSQSLCFMSKPKFETWFMEGRLEAGIHYVELKDDYSDLIEKMKYYLAHEKEALDIIKNANQYVEQFKDAKREKLISLLVVQKYFQKSGQL